MPLFRGIDCHKPRLIVMWKAKNNHISLPMPAHVIHKQRVTKQFHPNTFIQLSAFSNVYYNFGFVSRTLKDWNNLSNDIIEVTTLNAFKHAIPDIDFDLHSQSLFLVAGPMEQFSMCGGRSTSFEVQREGGVGVVDFKNGLPVADSICFNTVTTHQSFFVKAYQTRKEVVTKKCNHAEQHHNFCVFHLL